MSLALYTANDLGTGALESNPFSGHTQDITDIWIEIDVSTLNVVAGGSAGDIAVSFDGGATWTYHAGPSSDPVARCILSRFNPGEIHVITSGGYYQSLDYGYTWITIFTADVGETIYDLSLSHTRNVLASSLGVRIADNTGTLLTGVNPDCPQIISVTADIRFDRFYCYDADGQCYYMASDGATAFTAGATLPDAAQPMVRGAYRDGHIPGLIFLANGTNGVWKSVDGYRSSGGFFQLRKATLFGAGSGPWYQVGIGSLEFPTA